MRCRAARITGAVDTNSVLLKSPVWREIEWICRIHIKAGNPISVTSVCNAGQPATCHQNSKVAHYMPHRPPRSSAPPVPSSVSCHAAADVGIVATLSQFTNRAARCRPKPIPPDFHECQIRKRCSCNGHFQPVASKQIGTEMNPAVWEIPRRRYGTRRQ